MKADGLGEGFGFGDGPRKMGGMGWATDCMKWVPRPLISGVELLRLHSDQRYATEYSMLYWKDPTE